MREMTGIITVVQEGRFRLVADDGRSTLFVLSPSARLEPQDLTGLQQAERRVTVRYRDDRGRIAGLAHDIVPPRSGPTRSQAAA
ncbi:hypothetical protein SAMN05216548_101348 [Faunimonas pinastri]|uniref:Uncharacterized protein n=1 Tax=Faunimonas pinastri TaxID=1855383 RepID=A0A1H9A7C8_9HYPH|nr:hypothetical protein [Faunimonas pinastri]SEP72590.1 hypothetical protein SAMN05216548_101348 [Faunimonas pinastri]